MVRKGDRYKRLRDGCIIVIVAVTDERVIWEVTNHPDITHLRPRETEIEAWFKWEESQKEVWVLQPRITDLIKQYYENTR